MDCLNWDFQDGRITGMLFLGIINSIIFYDKNH